MAIARGNDTWYELDASPGQVASGDHEVAAGSDRIICSGVWDQGGDRVDDVDYDAVDLTGDKSETAGTEYVYVWHLVAPNTGTNTIRAHRDTSDAFAMHIESADYTGADQSSQPDSTASGNDSGVDTLSYTLTVVADQSWAFSMARNTGGQIKSDTNFTVFTGGAGGRAGDSDGALSSGNNNIVIDGNSQVGDMGGATIGIAPAAAAGVAVVPTLTLLGAG